jgi:hypothetical protein
MMGVHRFERVHFPFEQPKSLKGKDAEKEIRVQVEAVDDTES